LNFNEILLQSDDWLEKRHDYIQWLFPLREPGVVPSPLFTPTTEEIFRLNRDLQINMLRALHRMMSFYGLYLVVHPQFQTLFIVKSGQFQERSNVWISPGNHNYRRLTRILKSLILVGLSHYALVLKKYLVNMTEVKDVKAKEFWNKAMTEHLCTQG
jgi:hypothetical protein